MLARFVTFAFAAADLLIETDAQGAITFASGATSLAPKGSASPGKPLSGLFPLNRRQAVELVLAGAAEDRRLGPVMLELGGKPVRLSGWRLKDSDTIGWAIELADRLPDIAHEKRRLGSALPALVEKRRKARAPLSYALVHLADAPNGEPELTAFFSSLDTLARAAALEEAGGLTADRVVLAACESEAGVVQLGSAVGDICDHAGLSRDSVKTCMLADDPELAGDQVVAALQAIADMIDETGKMPEAGTLAAAARSIAEQRHRRLSSLSAVIRGRRIEPHAQVLVDAVTGEEAGYELLARLPGGRVFEPGVLLAEQFGMARDLDLSMLEFAIEFLENGERRPPIAVNLSGTTLSDMDAAGQIITRVERTRIDRRRLSFEVTESARIGNFDLAAKLLTRLRGFGCKVALDDFGSGACGLEYLQRLPCDQVKFEVTLIDNAMKTRTAFDVARASFKLVEVLGLSTAVERIETENQAALARKLGAARLQGWLFGKAMPLGTLMEIHKPDQRRAAS
ncbi:EAL domain-containing protein [Marinicauda algicola]|uniref:EAL domain-containing protein n=1 Tax=Marinicauda algicola TaxID=2029849 RepID=A0A4S2H1H9_9PROT|nr:EAL domain-containing protein [Marinicauda algicola]TGY89178.1 EAL domain-containing protein [Marinicauda algicola]